MLARSGEEERPGMVLVSTWPDWPEVGLNTRKFPVLA